MQNKTIIIKNFIWIMVLLASCTSNEVGTLSSNTPTEPAKVSTNESTSVESLAEALVSNADYLSECKSLNSEKLTDQISFRDIWPGRTKESELASLLGMPDERFVIKGVTNLVYGNIGFFVEENIVTNILVPIDKESAPKLEDIISNYGCPDIIFALNTTEDQIGYTDTSFIYYKYLGVDIRFANYPINLTDIPNSISYFQPTSLQDYLRKNGWNIMSTESGKPVDWIDAIK